MIYYLYNLSNFIGCYAKQRIVIGRRKTSHCQTWLKRRTLCNSESRIELRNLQILKKMLEKSSQFLSSEKPSEPKSLDVALKIAGDTLGKLVAAVNQEAIWF